MSNMHILVTNFQKSPSAGGSPLPVPLTPGLYLTYILTSVK